MFVQIKPPSNVFHKINLQFLFYFLCLWPRPEDGLIRISRNMSLKFRPPAIKG
jgi:hypothetical protein